MLSATSYAATAFSWDVLNGGDVDGDGIMDAGDIVYCSDPEAGDIDNLVLGSNAFTSIQGAVNAAAPGDTVVVMPGGYMENVVISKDLTLTGIGAPSAVVLDAMGEEGIGITVSGDNVTIQNLQVTNGATGVLCLDNEEGVVALNNVEFMNDVNGLEVYGGTASMTNCILMGCMEGVWVEGGVATIADSTFLMSGMTGVHVNVLGSAKISNSSINYGVTGVMVMGGTLLVETTNLNGNFLGGILCNFGDYEDEVSGETVFRNAVIDAGQLLDGTEHDFTGLGISSGGNNFSEYLPSPDPEAMFGMAIVNLSPDSIIGTVGPTGLPPAGDDMSALNNIWFSTSAADIERVIYHDPDEPSNLAGFVDYAILSDLDVAMAAGTVNEGEAATLTGSFLNDPQIHTLVIDWGDATIETVTLGQDALGFAIDHVYGDEGSYAISVTLSDCQGGVLADSALVDVTNVAPTLVSIIAPSGNEGDALAFDAVATDPGIDVLVYTWDFGDGSGPQTGAGAAHSYADNGDYTVTLTVEDGDGGVSVATAVATIANVAPAAAILGAPAEGHKDEPVNLSGSVADPGALDTHTFAWSVAKDGTLYGEGAGSVFSFTPDGSGAYVVSLTVTDDDGGAGAATVEVAVTNEPPTVAADNASVDVGEGATAVNTGVFADPNVDNEVAITASIGTVAKTGSSSGAWTWSWGAGDGPGAETVTITADDGNGGIATTTFAVTVHNVAPAMADATLAVEENSANGTLAGAVSAVDPGGDAVTYSIVGGSGSAAFAIDAATGEVTVADRTLLDYEAATSLTLEVQAIDEDGAAATGVVTVEIVNRASVDGAVFVDVNENGVYDADEPALDGVTVELLDASGSPVLDEGGNPVVSVTDGGYYLFEDLAAGTYRLREIQPSGVDDGAELLGSLGGAVAANDTMEVSVAATDAHDYLFAEIGQSVASDDTVSIGFWQSRRGRNLMIQGGTALADWLTDNFGNVFGDELVGADGLDVHRFYQTELFRHRSVWSLLTARVDIDFMSIALAAYFTNGTLAGDVGSSFGLNVTDTGCGTKVVNVGESGVAFGVADYTSRTIMQLLVAANDLTDTPDNQDGYSHLYDTNGDNSVSIQEAYVRLLADNVFRRIIRQGD